MIKEIIKKINLDETDIILYGDETAKIKNVDSNKNGKLIRKK